MCDRPYSSHDKWIAALLAGALYLLLASPYTFALLNKGSDSCGVETSDSTGCPNLTGLLTSGTAFTVILRYMMEKTETSKCEKPYTSKDKWIISLMGGLLFLVLASPFAYKFTNSILDLGLENDGCPTPSGLALHSTLLVVIVRALMR